MRIAVFGDSFAEKNAENIWWLFLQLHHGHTVTSFGEGGSSILFSAELVNKHAPNFDFAIWCLTTPGRVSLKKENNENHHFVVTWLNGQPEIHGDQDDSQSFKSYIDYLKYFFNWESENLIGRALSYYMLSQHPNLMIIPCFFYPLEESLNLYQASEIEAQAYFPNKTIVEIYQKYQDLRPGHLTRENQIVLSDMINQNLKPGIFQVSYTDFLLPTESLAGSFKRL